MSNCNPDIEIHKIPGSTQVHRMLEALQVDFVKVDERALEDLIIATNTLSQHINFYNKDNVLLGNWSSFFQWETTSVFAQIATIDMLQYVADFKVKKRKLLFISDIEKQKEEVYPFFENLGLRIKDVFKKVNALPSSLAIKEYYTTTFPTIEKLIDTIITEVHASTDLMFLLQNHLFNKKIQNLFGLITDWKNRSYTELNKNIESYPEHSPQYALYVTFLKLFGIAQEDLNTFTQKHLDFYYKNVLRLDLEDAQPDYVHLSIEPHKNEPLFSIEKDSIFLAGKDPEGKNKYYAATQDSTINQVKVSTIFGGHKKDNTYHFEDLTEKNAAGESWKAFSASTIVEEIGMAIASPLFFLRGGTRTIKLTFKNGNKLISLTPGNYSFYLSGEEEWIEIDQIGNRTKLDDKRNNDVPTLTFTIPAEEKAIVPFNAEIHEGVQLNTEYPVLKIVAKDGKLNQVKYNTIDIDISVSGYKQFELYSDTGIVDHTKQFQPFGPIPKVGSGLVFSCNEFFQKKGATGSLNISTVTPNSKFIRAIPQEVNQFTSTRSRSTRKIGLQQDAMNIANSIQTEVELITGTSTWNIFRETRLDYLKDGVWNDENSWESGKSYNISANNSLSSYNFTDNPELSTEESTGFAKIVLTDSFYKGENYLQEYIRQSKLEAPLLPYIPTIETITFDYDVASESDQMDLYLLYPRGYTENADPENPEKSLLQPEIRNEGTLFIGLDDVEAGNSISLLFQVAEGSANPRQDPVTIKWNYLNENKWNVFEKEQVGDESNGLTQSGIIQFNAPETLDLANQIELPSDMFWIKAEIEERVDTVCDIVGIHQQALKAVLFDYENTGLSFTENTVAKTVSKLFKPKNEIKKIEQPYDSFGGKIKETDTLFYQRASERLRHKDKAITLLDYEKLILDNFPKVFRVKCLNHYRYDSTEINSTSAGYVTIIPVAKGNTQEVPNYWKPIVDIGSMKLIKTFLQEKTSPHVRINVKPPVLEQLELDFKVKFKVIPGADSRLYTQQLRDEINSFLSPWAYEQNTIINFQTEIEKSKLIQIIEQQSYVEYITDFKVHHLILEEDSDQTSLRMNDVKEIIPQTDFTLFIPNNEHKIVSIDNSCCT